MSQTSSPGERYDYLVRAHRPALLPQVKALIVNDPSFTLLRQLGPPGEPHTLVVAMAEQDAATLQQRFPGELIVERDRPLTLFRYD